MAYSTTPGEMKTKIRILAPTDHPDGLGYKNKTYSNVYPDGREIYCKWATGYGIEQVQSRSLGLLDTATLTLRYNPRIKPDCIIVRCSEGDSKVYEIVSPVNDVLDKHQWMEFRVNGRFRAK